MKCSYQNEPQPGAAASEVSTRTDLLYPPIFFFNRALTAIKTGTHFNIRKLQVALVPM